MTLTRSQFEAACQTFIAKYSCTREHVFEDVAEFATRTFYGWSWHQHHVRSSHLSQWLASESLSQLHSGLGYLSRTISLRPASQSDSLDATSPMSEVLHVEDEATVSSTTGSDILTCQQYVIYSQTYQVPAFYFSVYRNGLLSCLFKCTPPFSSVEPQMAYLSLYERSLHRRYSVPKYCLMSRSLTVFICLIPPLRCSLRVIILFWGFLAGICILVIRRTL